uniref:Uncharacterized protein n=1 Tax=Mizugakiibacter sediminis TaxID=1475481 RepID=A0A0U1PA87_9GAMM
MQMSQSFCRPIVELAPIAKVRPKVGPETPRSTKRGSAVRTRVRPSSSPWAAGAAGGACAAAGLRSSAITWQPTRANSSRSPGFSGASPESCQPLSTVTADGSRARTVAWLPRSSISQ